MTSYVGRTFQTAQPDLVGLINDHLEVQKAFKDTGGRLTNIHYDVYARSGYNTAGGAITTLAFGQLIDAGKPIDRCYTACDVLFQTQEGTQRDTKRVALGAALKEAKKRNVALYLERQPV